MDKKNIERKKLMLMIDGKVIAAGNMLEINLPDKKSDGWPDEMTFELILKNGEKIYYKGKRAEQKSKDL